jgi:hypothetical protein
MTLPIATRLWDIEPNLAVAQQGTSGATNKLMTRQIKNALIAHGGATVDYSCDSSVAGVKGDGVDRWDSDADIVGAAGAVAHSWFVLTLHGGTLGQLLIDKDSNSDGGGGAPGSVYHSDAGFTGGSTTARPTAADEREITTGTNMWTTSNGAFTYHVWRCDTPGSESVRFAAIHTSIATGPDVLFCVEMARDAPAGWTPEIIATWRGGGAGSAADRGNWTAAGWQARVAGTNRTLVAIGDTPPAALDIDGDQLLATTGLNNVTTNRLGFVEDWFFVDDGFTNLGTFSDENGIRGWIAFDEVVWPWDGVTDPGAGNTAGAKLLRDYDPVPLATLVSTDPPDGDPLGADFENGRWQKITLVWTVPDGFVPMLTVRMADHAIWHTALIGDDNADFAPLFDPTRTGSSIQVAGGLATAVVLPLGGWWGAPEIIPGIFKEAT